MNIVNSFINVINLAPSTLTYEENSEKVTLNINSKLSNIIEFSNSSEIEFLEKSDNVNFNVKYRKKNYSRNELSHSFKHLNTNEEVECRVNLNKKSEFLGEIVYFFLDEFCEDLKNVNVSFLKCNGLEKKLVYIPISNSYTSGYLNLIPIEEFTDEQHIDEIPEDNVLAYQNHCQILKYKSNIERYESPLPLEINFKNEIQEEELDNSFKYLLYVLIIKLIAIKSENNYFLINGQSTIKIYDDNFFIPNNSSMLYELYDFIFDKDKYYDKVAITRNVITLYEFDNTNLNTLDQKLNRIYETINAHFSAYVQDSIENFFKSRKDIVKEAYESGIIIQEHTDQIVRQINVIILGFFTAILSIILLYSRGEKWILFMVLLIHILYFFISFLINRKNYKCRDEELEHAFDVYSSEFTTLDENKIDKIKDDHIKKPLKKLKDNYKLYSRIAISLGILILLICIGLFLSMVSWNDIHEFLIDKDHF